jgi:hypothetical protein
VKRFAPEYPTYGSWVGVVPISGYLLWSTVGYFFSPFEEAFGCTHVPPLGEHGVYQLAFLVDGPIQVALLTAYFDVGLVNVP